MTEQITEIDTLVVGAGQAGVAMSEHLTRLDIPHLVLEKQGIAQAWRSGRWDSLVANGPAWHDRFPGMVFPDCPADSFVGKEQVADYFAAYARSFNAPIRTGVEVFSAERLVGRPGFRIDTSQGVIEAQRIVAATGPFQRPVIPAIAPQSQAIQQLHSAHYFNPQQLPEGGVLVIGAGSSGVQIADELQRAGRAVWLSVGAHDRPPRRYRQRDFCWWLGVLGMWDAAANAPGKEHVTIAVSGARGGHTVDFRQLAHQGVTLVGQTRGFDGDKALFHPDLAENIRRGDAPTLRCSTPRTRGWPATAWTCPKSLRPRISARSGLRYRPLLSLNLAEAGIGTIIWATGYTTDYRWLKVNAFDDAQRPQHHRGVSTEPGVYFLGLPWLSRRGSTFIWGVWHDAKYIADQIAIQRQYQRYQPSC